MGLEEAYHYLGKWGRWQLIIYSIICLSFGLPSIWQLMAIVFIGVINPHHCKIDGNFTVKQAIPHVLNDLTDELEPSTCNIYKFPGNITNNDTTTCDSWTYDLIGFDPKGTITMEWDLVCDKDTYVENSQTTFNVGVCLGALFFTPFADRFGRKKLFFICQFFMNVFGICMSFSPNYIAFCAFQFLTGALSQGLSMTGFVIACELFPTELRTFMAPGAYLFTAAGMTSLSLWAYFLRDWRKLQLYISIPPFICLIFYYWCPESIRYLVANYRNEEAMKILKTAAKVNKVELPDDILDDNKPSEIKEGEADNKKPSILKMLKSPRPRRYMLTMLFLVLSNNLMYFGLSLLTAAMEGDRYINFLIVSVVEIPSVITAIIFSNKLGRRIPLMGFHLFSALFMILSSVASQYQFGDIDKGKMVTAFALISKYGVAGAWCIELVYAQEIYPTLLRSTGLGITAGFGFIGAILAPYSVYLYRKYLWVPGAVFGVLSFIASFLVLLEPETMGRALPDTVEEIASWTLTVSKEQRQEWAAADRERLENIKRKRAAKENGHQNPAFEEDKEIGTDNTRI